jgi:hypothetical protein
MDIETIRRNFCQRTMGLNAAARPQRSAPDADVRSCVLFGGANRYRAYRLNGSGAHGPKTTTAKPTRTMTFDRIEVKGKGKGGVPKVGTSSRGWPACPCDRGSNSARQSFRLHLSEGQEYRPQEAVRLCACLKHHGRVQLELAPLHGIRPGDAVRAEWLKHDSLADSLNIPHSLAGAKGFGVASVSAQDRNCSVEYT